MTAKHRIFLTLPAGALPDQGLVPIALGDLYFLGVLSSQLHLAWALVAGSRLGVGNDPRYNQSRCFQTFPFPLGNEAHTTRIRDLAEQLDAHRKRQQAAHSDLTLTGMYNVLEKLRSGDELNAKERTIHEHGLVSVLRQLHDELDRAVLDAYGWSDLAPLLRTAHGDVSVAAARAQVASTPADAARAFDEAILERLVALNAERAAEETRGLVRWLRPEFQNPQGEQVPDQIAFEETSQAPIAATAKKQPWPKELPDQVRAVADILGATPLNETALADAFTARGRWRERLPTILDTLVAIGRARRDEGGRYSAI